MPLERRRIFDAGFVHAVGYTHSLLNGLSLSESMLVLFVLEAQVWIGPWKANVLRLGGGLPRLWVQGDRSEVTVGQRDVGDRVSARMTARVHA